MTKKTTTLDLTTAQQAAAEADKRVTEIQDAIVAGDPNIKPGDIETAEADARLAHLRIEAARNAELDQAEQTRLNAIQAIRAEIEHTVDNPDAYVQALRTAEEAIIAFHELNETRVEQLRAWRRRLRELDVPEAPAGTDTPEPHGIAPLEFRYDRPDIRVGQGQIGAANATRYLKALVDLPLAALRDPSRRPVDLYTQLTRELGYIRKPDTDQPPQP
ncbi:hypothetical protein HF576_16445 [Microbacterium sp. CFH 90308]|uniref:Tail assembly chaperone n=1 Tax=Microbacterium salsuginis TaxID=2722803 RepID=A0ABX1KEF9_9MICO|nr:hypothetical protein [Microbacterium sp. CFH 90308]NLP85438.1 hypothetical protein [Microbacterium sp. CFH 90308]